IPLSYSQERLWFLDQLQGSEEYHIPMLFRLRGKVNVTSLSSAFREVVERHEVLRTVICSEDGVGYQKVNSSETWGLELMDAGNRDVSNGIRKYIDAPFDLSIHHMLRSRLYRFSEDNHLLVIVFHHIASDDWSESIIFNEFTKLYDAYSNGHTASLPALSVQYADYAIWQRKYLTDSVLENQLGYWQEHLSGVSALELPTDHARPVLQGNEGGTVSRCIGEGLSLQLNELSQSRDTTLFMTLLTAFKVLLYRYSGQSDICVGIPIANRTQQEIEPLVGFFLNTLALRSDLGGDPVFTELLEQVKGTTLGAYDHQEVPFEKVVDRVVKTRDMSRSPLFQVMFNFMVDDQGEDTITLGSLELTEEPFEETTSQFDLSFDITQTGDVLDISVEYSSDLYEEGTIVRMLSHYESLLASIVLSPEATIGELTLLSPSEETQLLDVFNSTDVGYPLDVGFVGMFESRVSKSPDGIALSFEG
ncbi:condensation domain-containing protein, partial [Maribacter sp. 2-571]|uniref:condensation domain-containing protein n=1 Tax=Maribacter sp. 2-571 TaxID=3417569 RepID=UPI003D358926